MGQPGPLPPCPPWAPCPTASRATAPPANAAAPVSARANPKTRLFMRNPPLRSATIRKSGRPAAIPAHATSIGRRETHRKPRRRHPLCAAYAPLMPARICPQGGGPGQAIRAKMVVSVRAGGKPGRLGNAAAANTPLKVGNRPAIRWNRRRPCRARPAVRAMRTMTDDPLRHSTARQRRHTNRCQRDSENKAPHHVTPFAAFVGSTAKPF